MSNYRPISLLSIFSKLFETIVAARLSNFLQKYNLLYDFQFGFRSGYSTKLALINSIDDILTHLDKRLFLLVFLSIFRRRSIPWITQSFSKN